MAPITRRSRAIARAHASHSETQAPLEGSTQINTSGQRRIRQQAVAITSGTGNLQAGSTRTVSSTDSFPPTNPATHASLTNRARNMGPRHGRPMQFNLVSGDDLAASQQLRAGGVSVLGEGGEPELRQRRSPLSESILDAQNDTQVYDSYSDAETEPDVDDDQELSVLAQTQPSVFQATISRERPSWQGDSDTVSSTPAPGIIHRADEDERDNTPTPRGRANFVAFSDSSRSTRNRETDLFYIPGSNRLTLSAQKPLIRVIVQDAIDDIRVSLLFVHAFPEGPDKVVLVQGTLLAVAEKYKPGSTHIHERLMHDREYMAQMSRLPRVRIPLFRGEAKEHCNALVFAAFAIVNSPEEIARSAQMQTTRYNYIFPTATHAVNLLRRTHPFRNERFPTVIGELYFRGGVMSFAARFDHLFPRYEGADGITRCEVVKPMVAFVGTALYAALHEWRTGERRTREFSRKRNIDVYDGLMGSLTHLENNRGGYYHRLMSDIYTRASSLGDVPGVAAVPTVELDLDEIED